MVYRSLARIVALPVLLAFRPARYTGVGGFIAMFALYGLAKAFESLDKPIFAVLRVISGHTLKHLAAAFGTYFLARL